VVSSSFYQGGVGRLAADDQSIYQVTQFGFTKWNISAGPLASVTLSNTPPNCGNVWIAADGLSIVTECGTVYTVSENEAQDLQYEGTLANLGYINWAAESVLLQSTAVIPQTNYNTQANDTEVQVFGEAYLGYAGSLALPQFMVGGTAYAGHGKFAFWNSAGTRLYVIEQADSTAKLLSSFAVATISPSASGCTFTLGSTSANESAGLGFDSVSMSTGAGCVWTATSNASWLTITAGSFSFGSGNLAFSFAENTATTRRTGTLTIAGQAFTVTQAGAPTAVTVTSSPSGASITVAGTACAPETVTTPANLSWSAGGVVRLVLRIRKPLAA